MKKENTDANEEYSEQYDMDFLLNRCPKLARDEFLDHIEGKANVKAVVINVDSDECDNDPEHRFRPHFVLRVGYTPNEYNEFLKRLSFVYNSGYGSQLVYGNIWYEDGTWSVRGEDDGREWWEYMECPEIPNECIIKEKDND